MNDRISPLDAAHAQARRFLDGLDARPVWPTASYEEMLAALGGPLPEDGADADEVVETLARTADPGLAAIAGGRFFGFVIGGALPAALGADWLTSIWDQNGALTSLTPAAAAAEQTAGRWIVEALGLPTGTAAGLVTGGLMANFTGLAAARQRVLAEVGWDVAQRGLAGSPPIRLVVGALRHDTIDLAARYLGFGRDTLVLVDADDQGRMRPDALRTALTAGSGPTIVCLQAGEVHTGAFDPFRELIPLAREAGAWIHVDGAFGLWASASPRLSSLTAGIEDADSWATDAHKTLNVPYDCGVALVRDPGALVAAFAIDADYIPGSGDDPMDLVPEFSRRARGFPVWAALRSLGRSGLVSLVETLVAHAQSFAERLSRLPGVEVVNDVAYTQVMLRLETDALTTEAGERILAEGTAVLTPAEWDGRAVLRCSVSSWATTEDDVERTVAAVERVLADLR
ncbi:aspartate aminotransferase family protein [Mumia sp. ZJ1417]|uniref:pyridoxal phosphate-dependent decarboxylase family protein n=1 Tax=Mumia sp. ZJ1417 TaxID=2708082 RepID=UPI0014228B80|nr:aminotransferase class V-fold PLP-dependent enzyme [Mumia sp. ZJ1417]QMW65460.1 aspartate aminotransferase family protein [Mumia sp. ZJ1417]